VGVKSFFSQTFTFAKDKGERDAEKSTLDLVGLKAETHGTEVM
jgi:hypothetical protein